MITEQAIGTAALDAWLAEHLFEWERHESKDPPAVVWIHSLPSCAVGGLLGDDGDCVHPTTPEHNYLGFSTTGDGMLMVVKALRTQGFYISFQDDDTGWGCNVLDDEGTSVFTEAEEAPVAVALAAKAALEAE